MRIPAFLALVLCCCSAYAQLSKPVTYEEGFLKDGYFGVHAGVAIPLGAYGDKDYDNRKAGYADLGYTINAELKYAFVPMFGINLRYFYTVNNMDASDLESDYNHIQGRDANLTYTSNPWTLQGFMIMPMLMWRSDKQVVELSGGIGWVNGTMPGSSATLTPVTPGLDPLRIYQADFDNAGIGYSVGLGFRYKLFKNIIASAHGDYTYADITFNNLSARITNSSGTYMVAVDDYNQPFSIIHLSIGVGYQFD